MGLWLSWIYETAEGCKVIIYKHSKEERHKILWELLDRNKKDSHSCQQVSGVRTVLFQALVILYLQRNKSSLFSHIPFWNALLLHIIQYAFWWRNNYDESKTKYYYPNVPKWGKIVSILTDLEKNLHLSHLRDWR